MNMPSVWDLIQQGDFHEACARADMEFEASRSLLALRNKVFALLQLGRLDESVALSRKIIEMTNGCMDSDFVFCGVAHWLKAETDVAIATWKAGLDSSYTDAAGGVEIPLLLFFAAIHGRKLMLEKEAVGMLKKAGKPNKFANWPGPVACYIAGELSEELLNSKIAKQPILRAKQSCQADFFLAIKRLAGADVTGYREKLEACVSHGAASFVKAELYLAKAELVMLNS